MKVHKHYKNNRPSLFLVPTPIGHLDDMTFRAIDTLKNVHMIFAEDTRTSKKILSHFKIDTPISSYHDFNEESKMDVLLNLLRDEKDIALISDAGMPLISDPGFHLVQAAISEDFNVVSLPGANAFLPALTMSGLNTMPFVFMGFLDSKSKKRKSMIERVEYYPETLIFYESIHRIHDTLKDLYEILDDRHFVIAREITKSYEEVIYGKLSEYGQVDQLKGELVLLVEGYKEEKINQELSIVEQVDYFIDQGLKKTQAMKKVSSMTNIPKNKIYQDYLKEKIKED